jgi:putative ABC transport system permease protein
VNETLARLLFPGRRLPAVIGERFVLSLNTPDTMVIAGIVADVRVAGPQVALRPTVYRPFANDPPTSMDLVVRAALPGDAVAALARRAVAELDRTLPIYEVATFRQLVAGQTARQRVELALLAAFSLLALLLAATGIYGVLAMEVGTRTREIAVRIALGAAPGRVRIAVVRSALAMTLLGLALGLLGAVALTRFMASLLFGIEPTDRLTYAAVVAALLAVALTAAWLPARRASAVEPMAAIRAE